MRWFDKKLTNPAVSRRVIRRFLWWPIQIDKEWRWLEFATIEQKFLGFGTGFIDPRITEVWCNWAWIDSAEETGLDKTVRIE